MIVESPLTNNLGKFLSVKLREIFDQNFIRKFKGEAPLSACDL